MPRKKQRAKRENGNGTVAKVRYKTKAGMVTKYRAVMSYTNPATGKKNRPLGPLRLTEAKAHEDRLDMAARLRLLPQATDGDMLGSQYFPWWLEQHAPTIKVVTVRRIISTLDNHILPHFGHIKIGDITPRMIAMWQNNLLKVLASSSVYKARGYLQQALDYAHKLDMITANPCDKVSPVRVWTPEKRILEPDEAKALIQAAQDTWYYEFFYTTLNLGLRSSEARGLRWQNVYEDKVFIEKIIATESVTQPRFTDPKTKSSKRWLSLSDGLKATLESQKRKAPPSDFDLVFTHDNGNAISPFTANSNLEKLCKVIDIEPITMHSLRHTFASFLIALGPDKGFDIVKISKMMGHANTSVTMKTYLHLINSRYEQKSAVDMDDLLNL